MSSCMPAGVMSRAGASSAHMTPGVILVLQANFADNKIKVRVTYGTAS